MRILVQTGFDGACPHSDRGVRWDRRGRLLLIPGWRRGPGLGEEVPGKGSRLSTRLVNPGKTPRAIEIVVDWTTAARTEHHDLGFVRHESEADWTMIPGLRDGARVTYRLVLAPGLTHLGLYPEYNVDQASACVRRLQAAGVRVTVAGRSRERRPVWLLDFPSPNPAARSFFIQARDHAYETAGSYCAEGIAEFLAAGEPLARYLRSKFSVHLMPMTNPDGVYNGMSQRTWERGPRMDQALDIADPAHAAVKRAVDRLRPWLYLTIHNWTMKFTDGLLYGRHAALAEAIRRFMPDDVAHAKHWDVRPLQYAAMKTMGLVDLAGCLRRGRRTAGLDDLGKGLHALSRRLSHWITYCEEQFDSRGLAMEFPWFGLDTAAMRRKGRQAFIAAALAAIEQERL